MKVIVPQECQIGAIKYRVVFNDKLLQKLDLSGNINSKDQMIRLSHRNTDLMYLILMHEATHGICDELGLFDTKTDDETFIRTFSTGLTIFLHSIGIELDFKNIMEED